MEVELAEKLILLFNWKSTMASVENWIAKLQKADKTCLVQDGKRKIHYTFPDKSEMAEEYSLAGGELLG